MITKQQEVQVTDWFMTVFWPAYPGDLCGRGKGSRAVALKHMLKINPDEPEQERIIGNLKAQIKSSRQDPNSCFWKIGETYVYNQIWNDEIESAMEIKAQNDLGMCNHPSCTNKVFGERFRKCLQHHGLMEDRHREHRKQALIELGLHIPSKPVSQSELARKCREYLQINGGFGAVLTKMKEPS